MVTLLESRKYTIKGEGIFIIGTAEELAEIVGYTAVHIRYLARKGKHFSLVGRDCSVSLMESVDDLERSISNE